MKSTGYDHWREAFLLSMNVIFHAMASCRGNVDTREKMSMIWLEDEVHFVEWSFVETSFGNVVRVNNDGVRSLSPSLQQPPHRSEIKRR